MHLNSWRKLDESISIKVEVHKLILTCERSLIHFIFLFSYLIKYLLWILYKQGLILHYFTLVQTYKSVQTVKWLNSTTQLNKSIKQSLLQKRWTDSNGMLLAVYLESSHAQGSPCVLLITQPQEERLLPR